jgi:hypothetical protein
MCKFDPTKTVRLVALQIAAIGCLASGAVADEHARPHVPMLSSPTIHEGAHINTEGRVIYLFNDIPKGFVTPNGQGSVHTVQFQLRYALDERWALIMTKGGWATANFENNLPDADGATNFAFGAKYAVLSNPDIGRYLTVGARYEAPVGDMSAGNVDLQGGGDGLFDMFASFSSFVGESTAFQSSAGFNLAFDPDHDSSYFHYSFHLDHEVVTNVFGFFEGNVLTTVREGNRTDAALFGDFEGYDLFNFGNTSSGTVVTLGAGARVRFNDFLLIGAGFEMPVTSREDIVNFRVLADAVVQF